MANSMETRSFFMDISSTWEVSPDSVHQNIMSRTTILAKIDTSDESPKEYCVLCMTTMSFLSCWVVLTFSNMLFCCDIEASDGFFNFYTNIRILKLLVGKSNGWLALNSGWTLVSRFQCVQFFQFCRTLLAVMVSQQSLPLQWSMWSIHAAIIACLAVF